MIDELKKVFLLGIGTTAYSYEKAENLVKDMVEKGKLTINEGKELNEELKRTINNKKENTQKPVDNNTPPLTKDDLVSILKEMDLASKNDITELSNRICKLEENHK